MTISAVDLDRDDMIHLSANAQKKVGKRAAEAMHHMLTGEGKAQPEIADITFSQNAVGSQFYTICIKYANIFGTLQAPGIPGGFGLKDKEEEKRPSMENIFKVEFCEERVYLRTGWTLDELCEKELWYGWGNDTYCNIVDGEDRAILAFGPIFLEKWK